MAQFDGAEWARWLEFKKIVGGANPIEIGLDWKRRQQDATIPFGEAVTRYLAAREVEGIGAGTLSHAKGDLKRAAGFFGDVGLSSITADRVRAFLVSLAGFAEITRQNHYKRVTALFNWARREGLANSNPCEAVEAPLKSIVTDEISVLSADDACKLFETARTHCPNATARLALEAFAGLRFSSACQLVKADVDFAAKGIALPAAKLKTRRRQYIEGLPENLWKWLEAAPAEAWDLTPRQYLQAKSDVFRLAKVANPGNVLRHSFCSYHVSLHKDAARTAVILCHSSPRTLYQHYRGWATAADAGRYFEIVPPTR